jgi:superfamily II DNA or RNA helicase/DNA-binding XRE family transcriptional regulator
MTTAIIGSPDWVRSLRSRLGLNQRQLAERLGVTIVTVSRWENGLSRPNRLAIRALAELAATESAYRPGPRSTGGGVVREVPEAGYDVGPNLYPDFAADPEVVRLVVEGHRLQLGHLFSPAFGIETALIDVLPHQYVAVYERMLGQSRLRMLLADDAGAGKTIMSGLYIREMLNRRLLRRVLVVCPAGLVGNWRRELRTLFSLHAREVTGFDCRTDNPFAGPGSDLIVVSVDTLTGDLAFNRLAQEDTEPYELVVIDEAHKLSAFRNADGTYETTDRYKLAELLAGAEPLQESRNRRRLAWHAHHLLLLTATPHMGKEFQYYALWRLLEPEALRTADAFSNLPETFRERHFIRRTKEEMVRLDGSRIYPPRESMTVAYALSPSERALYEELTSYVRTYFNRARVLNRSAVRLAMSVLQRRAASSTWALVRSLERRAQRLGEYIAALMSGQLTQRQFLAQQARGRGRDIEEEKTSDEEASIDGQEERDVADDEAMRATTARNLSELEAELAQVQRVLELARKTAASGDDSKFDKLREIIRDDRFRGEKILVFTEHRDTLEFLLRELEGMGYTDEVAFIHGGMAYREREEQMEAFRKRCRFMVATDAAGEGINLQFCWIMVNYDIPWNPARIEQRFGRIHRYKQEHDPVVLINMVAANTREGRVLQTLLEKLQAIRRRPEIGDRVFDVIGRQFQGISLSELIMRAVERDDETESIGELDATLTEQKALASREADARFKTPADDLLSRLPALREQRDREQLRRLLPGYVRRFIEKSAPLLGVRVKGDIDRRFWLEDLPLPLALSLEEAMDGVRRALTLYRPADDDEDAIFLRPGQPFFDRYRAYFCERFETDALRGAVFVDPYATEPYLYHLALVSTVRRADPNYPEAFGAEQTLDVRLAAVQQTLDGAIRSCPVELPMVLQLVRRLNPAALPPMDQVTAAIEAARMHLMEAVAKPSAARIAAGLAASVQEREAFLRAGFDYQEADLMRTRTRLRQRADAGDASARRALEEVRRKQSALAAQRDRSLAILRREPELVEADGVTFLAHALVLPSDDPEERERHDREIEQIAMRVARAYEESLGATVHDVSDPLQKMGFDLLSRRPDGEERCIEVKGRRAVGDVQLSENEWAKAANLRDRYWLYAVYDCAALNPRLLRVRDPFGSLLFKAKGGVIIDEAEIFQAAEQ